MATRAYRDTPAFKLGGGVGVSKSVGGDVPEPGRGHGPLEFLAEPVLANSVTVAGEWEVRGKAGTWVWDRSPGRGTGRSDWSIMATMYSSMGTMRSVSSLPRGA